MPGLIRFPPIFVLYDVAHSLPLGGVSRNFPFTEDETRRHCSYLSGTFRELDPLLINKVVLEYEYMVGRHSSCFVSEPEATLNHVTTMSCVTFIDIYTVIVKFEQSPNRVKGLGNL